MADLRLATRGSALAVVQAEQVASSLTARHPGLEVELLTVSTSGDRDRSTPVAHLTEMGAFVRAVQEAVLDGRADGAVHSCKDLPVDGPPGLVGFHPRREAPWDVLCGVRLEQLPSGGRVGTGSPRRRAQLAALRPDLRIEEIRGNIDTRLRKVAEGEFHALVLAEAGLRRLGRPDAWSHRFGLDEMVPAPGQGALTVETPPDGEAASLVGAIDHPPTRTAVTAERTVLALTAMGCRAALGAHAEPTPEGLRLTGFVEEGDRRRHRTVEAADPRQAALALCEALGLIIHRDPGSATVEGR